MTARRTVIYRLVLSALFMALGLVLPFFTGQIPEIGNLLLPMHLPVFLCGLICGWGYGAAVGAILPIFRSFLFGMPLLFPSAVGMAFELMTYGLVVGLLYALLPRRSVGTLYLSLVAAMVAGRLVWGGVMAVLLGVTGGSFPFSVFLAGAVLNAIPGIALQLVLVPATVLLLERAKVRKS